MKSAAIIGCGYIAGEGDLIAKRPQIFTHAKAILHAENIQLTACCDIDKELCLDFSKKWNVPKQYVDLNEMLKNESLDLLIVASPTQFHYDHVDLILSNSSVPAVFCEKPLADSFQLAIDLVNKAREKNKLLTINYMRRWDTFYHECKAIIESGELGRIDSIVGYVDTALYMNSIHLLDMIIYFGGDVLSCVGHIDRLNEPRVVHGKEDFGGYAFIRHKNGITSFIKASGESRKNNYFELDLQCTKGRLRILEDGKRYEVYRFEEISHKKWLNELVLDRTVVNDFKSERVLNAYQDILNCIENGKPSKSSADNALKSMEIIEMIYISDQKNNIPIFSSIGDLS